MSSKEQTVKPDDVDRPLKYLLGLLDPEASRTPPKMKERAITGGEAGMLLQIQNLAIQAAKVGFVIADAGKRGFPIIFANAGFETLTGYRSEDYLGRSCRFLQNNDGDQAGVKVMREALSQGTDCQVVIRNYRKDGTMFFNEISLSPIYDASGKLTHFFGVQNDVTRREVLNAERARYYGLLDKLASCAPLDELLGLIVDQAEHSFPAAICSLCLVPSDRDVSCCRYLPNPPRDDGMVAMMHQEAISQCNRVIATNFDLLRMPGELSQSNEIRASWMEPVLSNEGQAIGSLGLFFSESREPSDEELRLLEQLATLSRIAIERSLATEKLRESEERLRMAITATNDAVWDLDVSTNQLWWNQSLEEQFGRPTSDQHPVRWWQDLLHPDDRERAAASFNEFISNKSSSVNRWSCEYQILRTDGAYAIVEARALRIQDANGNTTRAIGALTDVSQRRALEKEVLDIAEAEKCRIGSDLHDGIGQELTGMSMLTDALQVALSREQDDSTLESHRKIATKLSKSLHRTLAQVRAFSHGLNPADLDGEGLAAALAAMTDRIQQLHGIQCHLDCQSSLAIDDREIASHVYRIAQEATTNAVKHAQTNSIHISLVADGSIATLEVKDDGVGIGQKCKDNRGMGLRTMQYRAELIGAQIDLFSPETGGTVMRCVFPI